MTKRWLAAAALLAAACEKQPDPADFAVKPQKPPPEVCAKTAEAIEKLGAEAGLETDGKGGAIVMEQAWLELGGTRDQLVQLVGFDAACRAAEPSREQNVVVRSEYGRVMAEQVVETSADLSALVRE